MAVVLGTNAGFVTTAPTDDLTFSFGQTIDARTYTTQDTSPSGTIRVIEMGWWCVNATQEANFEVGIYDDDGGTPNNLIHVDATNAKGTTDGWKRVTGLDWGINPGTTYWVAAQLDNTSTTTKTDRGSGSVVKYKTSSTTLTDPSDATSTWDDKVMAVYAVVEVSAGVTRKIKIGGTFVDKPIKTKVGGVFVDKPIKIKVGGTFQDA